MLIFSAETAYHVKYVPHMLCNDRARSVTTPDFGTGALNGKVIINDDHEQRAMRRRRLIDVMSMAVMMAMMYTGE